MNRASLSLLALLLAGTGAPAAVYRWTDDSGRVHYGDRPPAGGGAQLTMPGSAPAPAPVAPSRRESQRRLLDALETEREERRQEAAAEQERRRQGEQRCALARDHLRSLQEAGRLYQVERDGQRRYLSDDERALAIEQARREVRTSCDRHGAP